jgi:hypothetical protein
MLFYASTAESAFQNGRARAEARPLYVRENIHPRAPG